MKELKQQEDRSLDPHDINLYHIEDKFEISKEERAASIKRSKGSFHEFEKNKDNKEKYNPSVVYDDIAPQGTALKNRLYY